MSHILICSIILFYLFIFKFHSKKKIADVFSLDVRRVGDTKGVIRIRKSKNRQHNGQKKKYKRTNNDLQNIDIYRTHSTNIEVDIWYTAVGLRCGTSTMHLYSLKIRANPKWQEIPVGDFTSTTFESSTLTITPIRNYNVVICYYTLHYKSAMPNDTPRNSNYSPNFYWQTIQ